MTVEADKSIDTRPRLLVLASTYPRWRGDPEPGFVHELCRRLTSDFAVTALVPDAPGADPNGDLDGVQVVRYRYAPRQLQQLVNHGGIAVNLQRSAWKWALVPGFIAAQWLAARRLRLGGHVDLVHAHWLIPQGLVAFALGKDTPFLVTSHGGDLFGLRGALPTFLKRAVARAARGMTVVSSAMRAEAAALGLKPERIDVIPMGVDLIERFVPDAAVKRDPALILFVGRLVPKKGLATLFEAMPAILAIRPETVLHVAGFGPEEAALRALAAQLGIAASIEFLGALPQERLPDLFRTAALFVAPFVRDSSGNQEGLPVVLMEAIGCGCPVVVGDVSGVQDLLGEGHADVRVPPGDVGALASAVLRSLQDPISAQLRALSIRAEVGERIGWESIAAGYATALRRCLESARR